MVKVKRTGKKSRRQNDFYDFLCEHLEKNGQTDPVADIAADAKRDYIFPRGTGKTLDDFKTHLTTNYHPIHKAITALELAYALYLKQKVI